MVIYNSSLTEIVYYYENAEGRLNTILFYA